MVTVDTRQRAQRISARLGIATGLFYFIAREFPTDNVLLQILTGSSEVLFLLSASVAVIGYCMCHLWFGRAMVFLSSGICLSGFTTIGRDVDWIFMLGATTGLALMGAGAVCLLKQFREDNNGAQQAVPR